MYSLYKTIIQFQLPFTETVKLFHTYIEPILLYNVENWAAMSNKRIEQLKGNNRNIHETSMNEEPTTTQLKFLKFALGVKKQCPTLAVLGETAETPLSLTGYSRMASYWDRTKDMEDSTLVKKAYLENISTNSNWCQTIQHLNAKFNLHARETTNYPLTAKKAIRESFIQHWRHAVDSNQDGKLKFYSKMKKEFQVEKYLSIPTFADRQRITKLLCSNHNLEIEKGRHTNTPRGERKCTMCQLDVIEDEVHFLIECPAYKTLRETLNPHILQAIQNGELLECDPIRLTKYIKKALKKREEEKTFHVKSISICGTKLVLKRGPGPRLTKPELSHVSQTFLCNTRLKISKGKKTPRKISPKTKPQVSEVDGSLTKIKIIKTNMGSSPFKKYAQPSLAIRSPQGDK